MPETFTIDKFQHHWSHQINYEFYSYLSTSGESPNLPSEEISKSEKSNELFLKKIASRYTKSQKTNRTILTYFALSAKC